MSGRTYTRRGLLRAGAGAAAAATAAATAGPAGAQSGADFDGYLSDVANYDGTVADGTGRDSVTVAVGAQGNGGGFAFDPPAVKVDPGTTVVWEWTGAGGQHNVVENSGAFGSELVVEEGFTYEQSFESEGVVKYYCRPHQTLGMKGVVVVGTDTEATGALPTPTGEGQTGGSDSGDPGGGGDEMGESGSGGAGGEGDDGGGSSGPPTAANQTAMQTLLAMLVLGFLSPVVFALFMRYRGS
jgi:halocyanin-like protein